MTIAVGVLYPGGVMLGSDSFNQIGHEHEGRSSVATKVYSLAGRKLAICLAGHPALDVYYIKTETSIPVLDLSGMIVSKFMQSQRYSLQDVQDCMGIFSEVANFLGHTRVRPDHHTEVLVGWGHPQEFGLHVFSMTAPLWRIAHQHRSPCYGAGIYRFYEAVVQGNLQMLRAEDASHVTALLSKGKLPPGLRAAPCVSNAEAQQWITDVVEWCCLAFPQWAKGPVQICDTDTDRI